MRKRRPRFDSGEIIILIAIVVMILIVVTDRHRLILDKLFSPGAALIAVIMTVEYLLLRGADRSDIYRRELEAAREKRRDDLLALRAMEVELVELRAKLNAAPSSPGESAVPEANGAEDHPSDPAALTRRTIDKVLGIIRERI